MHEAVQFRKSKIRLVKAPNAQWLDRWLDKLACSVAQSVARPACKGCEECAILHETRGMTSTIMMTKLEQRLGLDALRMALIQRTVTYLTHMILDCVMLYLCKAIPILVYYTGTWPRVSEYCMTIFVSAIKYVKQQKVK